MLSYPRLQWIFWYFRQSQAVSGDPPESRRRARPGTPHGCWLTVIQAASGAVANDGEATDGQMGGRSGDEGPEAVALRDICRGTEAARWEVNLKTGYRVQPM